MAFFKGKPKSPKPQKKKTGLTEALIVSMVAEGMDYAAIRKAFPDMEEETLRRIVEKGMARVDLFLDG